MDDVDSGCKMFIRDPADSVVDHLTGLVLSSSGHMTLMNTKGSKVVVGGHVEPMLKKNLVTIVSGGGAGHEPFAAGFVGDGMLTAAVSGEIFTSPPPAHILDAIMAVSKQRHAGVLVIILNYMGDRLNFGLAVEKARALGVNAALLPIGDDCAQHGGSRRGLAGIVLAIKIAGYLSQQGYGLHYIHNYLDYCMPYCGTIGVTMSPCCVPGVGESFKLKPDEMELGLGIHGEVGCQTIKVCPVDELVEIMLKHMLDHSSNSRLPLHKNDRVVVMINNLGGTSIMEMNTVAGITLNSLRNRGMNVVRIFNGHFVTSLNMAGIQITVMVVTKACIVCALDFQTDAPAWRKSFLIDANVSPFYRTADFEAVDTKPAMAEGPDITQDEKTFNAMILTEACREIVDKKNLFNKLDSELGDADCGTTFSRGAAVVLSRLESDSLNMQSHSAMMRDLGSVAETSMGGTMGALLSICLVSIANKLTVSAAERDMSQMAWWVEALKEGLKAIKKYGGAAVGDRTMVDAFEPWVISIEASSVAGKSSKEALEIAFGAAVAGAKATTALAPKRGRAQYAASRSGNFIHPDAGAMAVAIIAEVIHKHWH